MNPKSPTEDPDNKNDVPELPPSMMADSHRRQSVMKQVSQPTRGKRRRSKPPAWVIRAVERTRNLKSFLRHDLAEHVRRRKPELITCVVSFGVHLLLGLILAAYFLPEHLQNDVLRLISASPEEALDEQPVELAEVVQPEIIQDLNVNSTTMQMLAEIEKGAERIQVDSIDARDLTVPMEDLIDVSDVAVLKGDFGGRSDAGRRVALAAYGGNAESEKSVSQGLTWLQRVQREDGSWSFAEVGDAGSPGRLRTTDMGATSLALLCFLGGGSTHKVDGPYKKTVEKGLAYLMSKAERGASGADMRGQFEDNSGMYVQGIATICLCEAAAMEPSDKELKRLAGDAVKFIERAQHRAGGGWRYNPDQPGDTSVVGWQVMALQSARAGRIKVLTTTMNDARKFLDSAEVQDGAMYSYLPGEGATDSMTAVGLLCRMYLGWSREREALKAGVQHLAKVGIKPGNIYYNYYATQVMHHWGGDEWRQWNLKMRDELVSTQVKEGPGAGSWNATDPHGSVGGRIYQTALSILTLEVYYRHLPIYRRFDEASNDKPQE